MLYPGNASALFAHNTEGTVLCCAGWRELWSLDRKLTAAVRRPRIRRRERQCCGARLCCVALSSVLAISAENHLSRRIGLYSLLLPLLWPSSSYSSTTATHIHHCSGATGCLYWLYLCVFVYVRVCVCVLGWNLCVCNLLHVWLPDSAPMYAQNVHIFTVCVHMTQDRSLMLHIDLTHVTRMKPWPRLFPP